MTHRAQEHAVEQEQDQDLGEIPVWARRYAQNCTLAVVASLVIFLAAFAAIGGLSYLTGWAYVSGQQGLAGVLMVLLAAVVGVWVWFSFVGGPPIMRRINERLYRGEGEVSVGPPPETAASEAWSRCPLVGFLFMFCILAHVGLGFLGLLDIRYMQPVSALYLVPFLLYLGTKMRGVGSPFLLMWPALYAIHAALLAAGAPIRFSGIYEMLNMLVPTIGYGLVAAVARHIYSRVALRRLRALAGAHGGEEAAQ